MKIGIANLTESRIIISENGLWASVLHRTIAIPSPGFDPGLYKMEIFAVHSASDCGFDGSNFLTFPSFDSPFMMGCNPEG